MCEQFQRRALIAVLLFVASVSTCFALQTGNSFNSQLDSLVQEFKTADQPGKAILLDRIYHLREYVSDPELVTRAEESVANSEDESPLIRDEANWHLAQIALHNRDIQKATHRADELGFIREWLVQEHDGCKPTGHEAGIAAKTSPLAEVAIHSSRSVCASTAIYVPEQRVMAIRFGANAPATLYVNGHLMATSENAQGDAFDQRSVGLMLPEGWNTIAIELSGNKAVKRFSLRTSGLSGESVGLIVDTSRTNRLSAEPEKTPAADLLIQARRKLQPVATAAALFELASLEQIRGFGSDLDRLRRATQIAPTAEHWIAVADACPMSSCRFAALNRALQQEPANAQARIELAEYYVDRKQFEKARNLLRAVVAGDPANYVARKRLADVYAVAGATSAAIDEYEKLDHGTVPLWLQREIAISYAAAGRDNIANDLLNRVWANDFDNDEVIAALQKIAESRGDVPSLRMLAQTRVMLDPSDVNAQFDVARYDRQGAPSAVAALVKASSDPQLRVQYAEMLAFAGHKQDANRQLVQVAESEGNIAIPAGTPASDKPYLVDAAKLAANVAKNPPRDNANVIVLADVSVERMLPNEQSVLHVQQVFYIANSRGAHDYSTRSINYSNVNQVLHIESARIYKPDGRVLEAQDQGDDSVADSGSSMYYDTRSHDLGFPGLHKGDVIEMEYRLTPKSSTNPYGDYFGTLVTFQTGLPQQLHRYVLIAPRGKKLHIVEERMPSPVKIQQVNDQTAYVWDVRNIGPFTRESRGPSLTEATPYVTVSTLDNWQQFGQWYANLIKPQFHLDADLRQALQRVTDGLTTDEAKIHAIHQFVLRNTHYVAMEFGVYSYKPYPVSEVYARRFGDCKDKASLMIAMLEASGIDADIALVRTRSMGDVNSGATSVSVFNHAIVYIPKYDMWLDGTAEYSGSRELPLDDQGAMAVTVGLDGNAQLRRIPVTLPMQNYTHRVVRAKIENDGKIVFVGSAYTRGEDAPGLRREFESTDRQRDSLRNNLAAVYPSIKVNSVQVEGANDLEHDINVNFSGSLDTFAGQKSFLLAPSWLAHRYVNSLAPLASRTQALEFPAPWTNEEELHFTIPDGASFKTPAGLRYDTQFGTAVIRYERHGRELVVTNSVQFRKLNISPAEYGAFRDFCEHVEQAFREQIEVKLPG